MFDLDYPGDYCSMAAYGGLVVFFQGRQKVALFDWSQPKIRVMSESPDTTPEEYPVVSDDGTSIMVLMEQRVDGRRGFVLQAWNASTSRIVLSLQFKRGAPAKWQFTPDGKCILLRFNDGTWSMYDLNYSQYIEIAYLKSVEEYCEFSPAGHYVLTNSRKGFFVASIDDIDPIPPQIRTLSAAEAWARSHPARLLGDATALCDPAPAS